MLLLTSNLSLSCLCCLNAVVISAVTTDFGCIAKLRQLDIPWYWMCFNKTHPIGLPWNVQLATPLRL